MQVTSGPLLLHSITLAVEPPRQSRTTLWGTINSHPALLKWAILYLPKQWISRPTGVLDDLETPPRRHHMRLPVTGKTWLPAYSPGKAFTHDWQENPGL
ncbi:Cytochrome P450 monooxygenase COX2 [Fusarium oxysporum f. sp. albedinis]|nr:Cytochrome P450 monooxygenase COX2 [Fusarium oxysporum f. sp. albedinis]